MPPEKVVSKFNWYGIPDVVRQVADYEARFKPLQRVDDLTGDGVSDFIEVKAELGCGRKIVGTDSYGRVEWLWTVNLIPGVLGFSEITPGDERIQLDSSRGSSGGHCINVNFNSKAPYKYPVLDIKVGHFDRDDLPDISFWYYTGEGHAYTEYLALTEHPNKSER